jgi:hypothetical protein
MVTTTTTLPTSRPIDDACSEERVEPIWKEADMNENHFAPRDRLRQARFSAQLADGPASPRISLIIVVEPL